MALTKAICTIITCNNIAKAKCLFNSLRETHPAETLSFYILLVDDNYSQNFATSEDFKTICLADLAENDPELSGMSFLYSAADVCATLIPYFLRHLFIHEDHQDIIFFDAEVFVLSSMKDLFDKLSESPIVLTPQVLTPPQEERENSLCQSILVQGCFNLGILLLRKSGAAIRLLDWWKGNLRQEYLAQEGGNHFRSARWLDLIPGLFPEALIYRNKSCNVGDWNLYERPLRKVGPTFFVDNEPLRFFYFRGYQQAPKFSDGSVLGSLTAKYSGRLNECGHMVYRNLVSSLEVWSNGIRIPELARRIFGGSQVRERFPNPRETSVSQSYFSWLMEGDEKVCPRLLFEIWQERPDVRLAIPEPNGRDQMRLRGWGRDHGIDEYQLDPKLGAVFCNQSSPSWTLVPWKQDQSLD